MSLPTQGGIKRNIAVQVTANETTEVTTTINNLKDDSVVIISANTIQGTPSAAPYVSTKNTSTGVLGIKAGSGDTSIYDVVVFN